MARLKNQKIISGLIGNLVFRNLNGMQVVQSHPGKIKQNEATKTSATEFGQSSSWAKQLRVGLEPFLVHLSDAAMYQRFTARLYAALLANTALPKNERTPLNADMTSMAGFEFNRHAPFVTQFLPAVSATMDAQRRVTVTVPPVQPLVDVLYPEGCTNAEVLVYLYATTLAPNAPIADGHFTIALPKQPVTVPQTVWTSPELPEGHFVMVCAKVLYYETNPFTGRTYLNSTVLNPSVVVLARATGN